MFVLIAGRTLTPGSGATAKAKKRLPRCRRDNLRHKDPIPVYQRHGKMSSQGVTRVADGLRELRLSRQIPAKDMVEVIQKLYPKYDKTVQSKCENGDAYGVSLRPDALKAVYEAFAPDALESQERPKRDYHRRTCRISARLDGGLYAALQQRMEADGYKTAQDWINRAVEVYLESKGRWPRGAGS